MCKEAFEFAKMAVLWVMVLALILVATYAAEFSVHGEIAVGVAAGVLLSIPALTVLIGYYVFVI